MIEDEWESVENEDEEIILSNEESISYKDFYDLRNYVRICS